MSSPSSSSPRNPLHADHHIVPIGTYAMTLGALLVLMALTVWVAEINLPPILFVPGTIVNQGIALAIAVVKASLVVAIFMGVKWSTQLTKFWALLGFTWLAFFSIMAGDYAMRKYENVQGWEKGGESALPRTLAPSNVPAPEMAPNDINVRPRQ